MHNREGIVLELDFEKAFDCVNWDSLLPVMEFIGFVLNGEDGFMNAYP